KDRRGRIWVSTMAGASVFDPAREAAPDRTKDPLLVERVVVNGKARSLAPGAVLSRAERNLSFELALLSFGREPATRYRTHLVGFDPAPSDWKPDFRTDYTNIPPGRYTFRAWGRDQAGNVSGPVDLPFAIRPAAWQMWWAYFLYLAALSALAW